MIKLLILFILFIFLILAFLLYSNYRFEGLENIDIGLNKDIETIPPIYVINLKDRTDRKFKIEDKLRKHGLTGKFVGAVNGAELDIKNLEEKGFLNIKRKLMKRGEIACYLSHIKCWFEILKSDSSMGLIFEDDIILKSDFVPSLSKKLNSIKDKKWDIFYLGRTCYLNILCSDSACITGENVDDDIIYPKTIGWGTFAYIIKRETIMKILSEMFPINQPIDWILPNLYD